MDHLYIRTWHRFIHDDDTIGLSEILAQADKDNCPDDALYFIESSNRWVCLSEITNTTTLKMLDKIYRDLAGLPPVKEQSVSWF